MYNHKFHCLILLFIFFGSGLSHAQTSILPNNVNFQYTGRIDYTSPSAPILYYAGSYITTRFEGTSLKASFKDITGNNYIGFIIDGGDMIIKSAFSKTSASVQTIATGLSNTTHDLIIVKRNAPSSGAIVFYGLTLDAGKSLVAPPARPARRIEIFGNSISAGVNADNLATNDDKTTTLDNGWNSYSNVLARKLNAEIHNNGIPGIAVMTGTGYYPTSADVAYNKLSPFTGYYSNWDFSKFTPQVVIMAYGVNDDGNNWVTDANKETWKTKYKAILSDLMTKYPLAHFIFEVPPMGMDRTRMEGYDQEIVTEVNSQRVHFYNFTTAPSPSGCHPAKLMHQAMADELYAYINNLGIYSSTDIHSIEDFKNNKEIDIYPNPTHSNFSVEVKDANPSSTNYLSVLDLTGKKVFSKYYSENPTTVNTSEWSSKGMFVVNITNGYKNYHKKLLVE